MAFILLNYCSCFQTKKNEIPPFWHVPILDVPKVLDRDKGQVWLLKEQERQDSCAGSSGSPGNWDPTAWLQVNNRAWRVFSPPRTLRCYGMHSSFVQEISVLRNNSPVLGQRQTSVQDIVGGTVGCGNHPFHLLPMLVAGMFLTLVILS